MATKPGTPRRVWTQEEDQLLGLVTDAALAQKLGIPCMNVTYRRNSLNIPSNKSQRKIKKKIAGKFGPKIVIWSADMDAQLGKKSDREVAKDLKLHFKTVAARRNKLRILPFRNSAEFPDSAFEKSYGLVTKESKELLEALRPKVIASWRAKGIPTQQIKDWQIIQLALQRLSEAHDL